jgi:hypothetical protein
MGRSGGQGSGFAVDLCPPPAHADEQETPVVKELRRLSFEGVSDELKNPSDEEQAERIRPKTVEEETGDKKRRREQDGRDAQSVTHPVHRMLMTGRILRDPLLVGASAQHAQDNITIAGEYFNSISSARIRVLGGAALPRSDYGLFSEPPLATEVWSSFENLFLPII